MISTTTPKKTIRAGDNGVVVFRELKDVSLSDGHRLKDCQLWTTEHIQYADLGRLHLRALEAILSPTTSSEDIISAVAFGVTSQGLRVTHRDDAQGRIVAQRIEAPYLASFSGRNTRSAGTEWRVVVATLSVSKGFAAWGGVERVLLLEFMTDPCPKQDLAGRGAAAVASFAERLRAGSVAAGLSSATSGKDSSGGTLGRTSSSLSAVAIAHQRSNQRADALVEGVAAELGRLGCAADDVGVMSGAAASPPAKVSGAPAVELAEGEKGADGDDTTLGNDEAEVAEEDLVLAPFEGGGGVTAKTAPSLASVVDDSTREGVFASSKHPLQRKEGEDAKALGGGSMVTDDSGASATVEVHLCLQFVEGLCARAEEYSRRDALETWRPLEDTVRRLEGDNEKLRQLLEPKYRNLCAVPPPVPTWSGHRGYGGSSLIGTERENQSSAGGSRRVAALLQSNPLFVVEGISVKARVVVPGGSGTKQEKGGDASNHAPALNSTSAAARTAAAGATGAAGGSSAPEDASPSGAFSDPSPSAIAATVAGGTSCEHDLADCRTATGARRSRLLARAVVKALATVVSGVCESREEDLLKDRIPGAQAYVAELEAYRSAIVGGKPLRAVPASPRGEGDGAGERDGESSAEVDDDLWRLFGAMETRLYSSPAALGKKPGRIYLTFNTLWFHSKVLGFEARHVLPLAEVNSVVLLGTALDLSASLVVTTKGGDEVMFVFPGQRTATLEPVELLIRQLARVAKEESADNP